ncbi:hypothetical protein GQ55_1G321400 [Panicum hallii var. hallii]|uniref:Uncharacterized protein n=1 Tax=Panicum hallii var. hallii TaxID=1504633 RepID=A0A2T7F9S4_9POAL|nr:hypothetical protein GQ55_1G321400 [Panicum hallii var. hallii]
MKGDPRTCGFIRCEQQCETYLRGLDARLGRLKQQCGEIEDFAEARAQEARELKD